MKIRSVLGSALAALLLIPACGSDSSGGASPGSAGFSAGGAPVSAAGAANNVAGAANNVAGAPAGGAPSEGGAGAPVNVAGASPTGGASAGGSSGAGTGGGASGGSSGGAAGSAGAPSTTIPDTKVVMYLPNWSGSFSTWATKVDFNKMTHLNLAFGVMSGATNWSLGANDADVKALAAAAHAKNVKVLVSIGGADDDIGIINAYGNQANIDPMIANMDAFLKRLDLDGVDVDLERGSGMKTGTNFPMFVNKLVSTLRPEGKLVTAALAQYIAEDTGLDATSTGWMKQYDFINLMIYNTNMNTYTSELNFWTTKVGAVKTKLVWGIEFSSKLNTDTAKQLTTASKADGGVMIWEYSQGTESTLWPAVQSVL
jgi:GH18 family chitinase